MRQYELAIRIAQIHHLVDERKYKKALAVIQTLDMHQVRSLSDLKVFAEVYTKTEQYDAAKATYLRIYRRSRTKRVLYRLIYLSIRTNALHDAETYYQEFIRMNPNIRDSLILRYRIDKASGAPVGQLIEILQELKQEEYIEEWAYELAKLYHRAGRTEECIEECEDILLWFGTGEIVQRAKILIEHLKDKEPMPFYDDKDFTLPKKEEPNPDDTGSLPDLEEFIKEKKARKKEEKKEEKKEGKRTHKEEQDTGKQQKEAKDRALKPSEKNQDGFVDDYDDSDFDADGIPISQVAHKITDLFKLGKKEETSESPRGEVQEKKAKKEPEKREEKNAKKVPPKVPEYVPHSQSGTGITQDLAKEISAIYEMEHREQLREKEVTVIDEVPASSSKEESNLATDVVERMSRAFAQNQIKRSTTKTYIPLDVEEIRGTEQVTEVNGPEEITKVLEPVEEDELSEEELTEDLYEEEFSEASKISEEEERAFSEESGMSEEEERAFSEESGMSEEEERAVPEESGMSEEEERAVPEESGMSEEERPEEISPESDKAAGEGRQEEEAYTKKQAEGELVSFTSEKQLESILEQEVAEIQRAMEEEEANSYEEKRAAEALQGKNETEAIRELLTEEIEETEHMERPESFAHEQYGAGEEEEYAEEEPEETAYVEPEEGYAEREPEETEPLYQSYEETAGTVVEPEASYQEETVITDAAEKRSVLEGYQAPEIPVVETEYMEMPEIHYEDLPTTRALQRSFSDIIQLIKGERDPSHFVLIGSSTECMVGVSKRIVRAMKETGYLSIGRIAKIHAKQINTMDLISFRSQLKGNCLLIEGAADLLFPTITRLFSIMEEYYGDFVVILADEGNTLDQLFRFVPALAKRFKYIIDISEYTPADYEN